MHGTGQPIIPILMPREAAAAYLSVSPRTLDGLGIPARRMGSRGIRYHRSDLDAFAADLPYVDREEPPCEADEAFKP